MSDHKKAQFLISKAAGYRGTKQDPIKYTLANAVAELGYSYEIEFSIGAGAVDLFLNDRRVLIECKPPGTVDPAAARHTSGETQFEQLQRYVVEQRRREIQELSHFHATDEMLDWIGMLTDGSTTYVYRWQHNLRTAQPIGDPLVLRQPEELFRQLSSLKVSDGSLPLVPKDPTPLFDGKESSLQEIWTRVRKQRHAITQHNLWEAMLNAAGVNTTDDVDVETMFIKHCLLVCIARSVSANLLPPSADQDIASLARGYTDWIYTGNQHGRDWLHELYTQVSRYDWRKRDTDVLRTLYENVIPKRMRKVYGEYYTPDWLAQYLVEEVLDQPWVERAAENAIYAVRTGDHSVLRGCGVLDPTCGSGTFLYHAAKHLLNSETLKASGVDAVERSKAVCALIFGLDIHPVAIEFSRATLQRALPAPVHDINDINIYQGDSLLATQTQVLTADGRLEVRSPQKRTFYLPKEFLRQASLAKNMEHLVTAANAGEDVCPGALLIGFDDSTCEIICDAFDQLKQICAEEGNGVWWYHVMNLVAPYRLSERKIDRIVANPPWVRMNEIQIEARKNLFEELARELKVWRGGQRATAMDIGGVFVLQCSQNYLSTHQNRSAWLLNDASRTAGSWQNFRDQLGQQVSSKLSSDQEYDRVIHGPSTCSFAALKGNSAPFTGASSCAWFVGLSRSDKVATLRNEENSIRREFEWSLIKHRISFQDPPTSFPVKPSEYVNSTGSRPFKNGASVFPHALLKVERIESHQQNVIAGYTGGSRNEPWKTFNHRFFKVPARWVQDLVFSSDLLCYCVRSKLTQCIVPMNANRSRLLSEQEVLKNSSWKSANDTYVDNSGIGMDTPKTLLERIDKGKSLTSQIEPQRGNHRVVYNKAGSFLRASRVCSSTLIENTCYRVQTKTIEEAIFLVSLFNASVLQEWYQASRETDRDFNTHFWYKVPIPLYNPSNQLHKELVKTGARCELAAEKVRDSVPDSMGQRKLCQLIREHLLDQGLSQRVDEIVHQMFEFPLKPNKTP